jgi:hemerythrin-like domain-containing protein
MFMPSNAIDVKINGAKKFELRLSGTPRVWRLFDEGGGDVFELVNSFAVQELINKLTERRTVKDFPDSKVGDKEYGLDPPAVEVSLWHNGVLPEKPEEKKDEKPAEEVSPPEDLMREHGVLKRILLIYGEALRRMDAREDLPPEPIQQSAKLIRSFVEDYHEKLEENYLFPRFKKANKLVDLVEVLNVQHQAGRKLTDITLRYATVQSLRNVDDRRRLADSMRQFIRMYNPHEAREDTVLFPAFRGIVSANEFDSLGEEFEKQEDKLFGDDGFFKVVDQVAEIEKKLGIYDLSKFTPKV